MTLKSKLVVAVGGNRACMLAAHPEQVQAQGYMLGLASQTLPLPSIPACSRGCAAPAGPRRRLAPHSSHTSERHKLAQPHGGPGLRGVFVTRAAATGAQHAKPQPWFRC